MKQLLLIAVLFLYGCNGLTENEQLASNLFRGNTDNWMITWDEYPGNEPTVVLMGDSRLDLMPVANVFPNQHVINIAQWGTSSANTYERTNFISQFNPDIVFVSVGYNDIAHLLPCSQYQDRMRAIIRNIQVECPFAVVYVTKIVPPAYWFSSLSTVQAMNNNIEAMITSEGAIYVDMTDMEDGRGGLNPAYSDDGLHYNSAGYEKFKEIIHRYF